jgi:hypothetical protein
MLEHPVVRRGKRARRKNLHRAELSLVARVAPGVLWIFLPCLPHYTRVTDYTYYESRTRDFLVSE